MGKQIIFFLLGCIVLNACAYKISLIKRNYSKGYYLSLVKPSNKPHKSLLEREKKPERVCQNTPMVVNNRIDQEAHSLKQSTTSGIEYRKENSVNNQEQKLTVALSAGQNNLKQLPTFKPISDNLLFFANNPFNKKEGKGAKKLFLVILALFPLLCLIAVFVHDDKSVTMNFWLTLILHITLLGYAIFALLVVLNIVDLR